MKMRATSCRAGDSRSHLALALVLIGVSAAFAAPAAQSRPADELIRGIVYRDANGNGRRDRGEAGIGGVGVSNAVDLMLSGADGSYTLPGRPGRARLVYISIPSGYAKQTTWYWHIDDAPAGSTFDFGLCPADESGPFDFVQVTDLHISSKTSGELYAQALAEIARLPRPPAFVMATGDLVNVGQSEKEYQDLVAALATSKVPVFNVPGNHDADKGSYARWRENLGPEWYSFDYGDTHFLSVNCVKKAPEQAAWIEQDLKLLRGKKRLLVFQHFWPAQEDHDRFRSWGAAAVFSGHWHNQHTVNVEEMRSYNTSTTLFGGIDCSPAGFKVITVGPDQIRTRSRFLANGKCIQIVSPGSTGLIMSQTPIVVNAYETSGEVTEVRFELKRGEELVASGALRKEGDWSWLGRLPELERDTYRITATAKNHRGEASTDSAEFLVVSGKPAVRPGGDWTQFGGGSQRGGRVKQAELKPPLAVAWTADTGGTIDFASPVLKSGSVYIGVKDRGDFDRNGVLALDAETGSRQWFAPTPAAVCHSVAVDDTRVYASGHGGTLHTFERLTGKPVYTKILGSSYQRFLYGSPTLLDGRIFVGTAAYFAEFDARSGDERWNGSYGNDWIGCDAAPATDGKVVLVPANWQAKSLRAISAADGKLLWDYACKGLHGTPVIAGERVVFTTYGGDLIAAELASGKKLWSVNMGAASVTTPAVADDVVVAGGTGSLRGVRLSNGEELWQVVLKESALKMGPYDITFAALPGSATIVGGTAFAPCGDGRLYAVELTSGRVTWSMNFGVPVVSAPCISGNALFLTTYDGHVYALVSKP